MDESNEPPRALRYHDAEAAADALERWAEKIARLEALRDPIVAGALAAGLRRAEVHRISGIAKTTIDRIKARDLALASEDQVLFEYTELLSARAARYRDEAPEDFTEPPELHGRAQAARFSARALRGASSRWGGDFSEDADLLALIIDLDQVRDAEERHGAYHETDYSRGIRLEQEQIRAEAAALRSRGRAALEEFDPRDRARAATVAHDRAVRSEADALGITPAELAVMTDEQKAQAWANLPDDEVQR